MRIRRDIVIEGDLTDIIHNFINELKTFINAYAIDERLALKELRLVLSLYKRKVMRRLLGAKGLADYFACRLVDLIRTPLAYDKSNPIAKTRIISSLLEAILNYPNLDTWKFYSIVSHELRK